MPVSHPHRCVFVHIPKTGGTSIEHLLGVFRDWRLEDCDCWFGRIQSAELLQYGWITRYLQHLSWQELACLLPATVIEGYFCFSFVRNPWDRMVSIYSNPDPDLLQMARGAGLELAGLSFTDFVLATRELSHVHLLAQSRFITDASGAVAVNFLGRFERFGTDMQTVLDQLGLTLDLPHLNRSCHTAYRDYYTAQTRVEIARRYEQDVDLLRYTF